MIKVILVIHLFLEDAREFYRLGEAEVVCRRDHLWFQLREIEADDLTCLVSHD